MQELITIHHQQGINLSNIKEILTYQIKKLLIPLIIFAILGIFNYSSDEFHFIKLNEEIIPSAYSQTCGAGNAPEFPRSNPTSVLSPTLLPFQVSDIPVLNQLLKIKIEMDPIINNNEQICYNYNTLKFDVRKKDGTIGPPLNKLKLEIKSNKLVANFTKSGLSTIDLKANPIIKDIDPNNNGILSSLEPSCIIQSNKIDCSRGLTKLTINFSPNDNKKGIFLGESATNSNGIIIITEKTRIGIEDIKVEACEKEQKITYLIPANSVLEIDCG